MQKIITFAGKIADTLNTISRIQNVICLVLLLAIFSACNSTDKLLKNPDFGMKYRTGNQLYEQGKYDKAILFYENILPFYRSSVSEDTITIRIAKSYYEQRDYEMSQYYFGLFRQHFSRSPFAEEASYLEGFSAFSQSVRPSLDQKQTYNAIQIFQQHLRKYPRGEHVEDCKAKIIAMEEKLAEKAFYGAKVYYTTEHYRAAVVAMKNCIKAYPESKYREEMFFLVLKSSYLHAQHSVLDKQKERYQVTIDEYFNLQSEFPTGRYKRDAEKIYQELLEKIKS
ncbi:MAG: outer membrane protein assembly factor BamD [Bacteroidales bacterium]